MIKQHNTSSIKTYTRNNPEKAKIIKKAIKNGVKQYAETFRKLAST